MVRPYGVLWLEADGCVSKRTPVSNVRIAARSQRLQAKGMLTSLPLKQPKYGVLRSVQAVVLVASGQETAVTSHQTTGDKSVTKSLVHQPSHTLDGRTTSSVLRTVYEFGPGVCKASSRG